MGEERHHFLTTLPGILSGLAAVVTAGATTYALIDKPDAPPEPKRETAAVLAPQPSPPVALASPAAAQPARRSPAAGAPFSVAAVIEDPDGYVNVRAARSTKSRIVAVVRLNEPFRTHPQPGAWWLVRTGDGTQGYIYASRIRMIDG